MSSWTQSSVSLSKLHEAQKPLNDKSGLGFNVGESSVGETNTQSNLVYDKFKKMSFVKASTIHDTYESVKYNDQISRQLNQKGKAGIGYVRPENTKSSWIKNRLDRDKAKAGSKSSVQNQQRRGSRKVKSEWRKVHPRRAKAGSKSSVQNQQRRGSRKFSCGNHESSTCVTLNGSGIQLAVGPQPLRLRNHNFGLAQRIMVKRLATSRHDPLGIFDSACKNQSVVVSVQYGPFNTYIPIRSTTIGKLRVAKDPITMHTSWRSNSDIASITRALSRPPPILQSPTPPPPHVDRTCSDHRFEEFPSVLISSGLLVQADEGTLLPVVDLIDDLQPPTDKSQFPCDSGWSQAPRRQQDGIRIRHRYSKSGIRAKARILQYIVAWISSNWMRMAAESWPPPSRMEADQLLMDARSTGRHWPSSRAKVAHPMAAGCATLRAAVRRAWRDDVRLPGMICWRRPPPCGESPTAL
ncbi:hypothetical protein F511_17951 [Dorcoceras hygrometricum]|uniref:Uncharacterized protein n=1 Tax=Dorcoceras hygrometricum TaxID=472368 RepID=A0A2Z7API0_9LAMI|nr:hypothetical protein F511_17951 [Dorcoceras hygrometricum]